MNMQTLRVQAPASLCRILLADALPRFIHTHPGLRVQMREMSSVGDTLGRDADAALSIGPIAPSSVTSHQVGAVRSITCASTEFIERHGRPDAPADLDPDHCIALLEPRTHCAPEWLFRRGSTRYTISPTAPLAFSDAASAVAAAVRGGGYVRVLSIEAEQQIAAGLLQPVLEEWNQGFQPVVMIHARDRVASDVISAFRAFVTSLFPSAPVLPPE